MARSVKETIQNVEDKKGAKSVDKAADGDKVLRNIDRISYLQNIYKKIDNRETLTDEERKAWQSLSPKDKMKITDAYHGVNMRMTEPTTFANLDVHSKDYSELAPETEPKDTESEKVFNPSKPDVLGSHLYSELQALVGSLKATNVTDPTIIKNIVANVLDAKGLQWDKTIDTIDGEVSKISDVVNSLIQSDGSEDPNENWDQAKAKGELKLKSEEEQDRLHKERLQRIEQAAAEKEVHDARQKEQHNFVNKQSLNKIKDKAWRAYVEQNMRGENYAPTLEGLKSFNDEINPDKSDEAAILARQPQDKIMVKNLENLLGDNAYAETLRNIVADGKTKGKTFNEILLKDIGQKHLANIAEHTNNDTDKSSEILKYLGSIYDNTKTDKKDDIKQALDRKETRALKAGKRAEDKLKDAMANLESPGDLSETPSRGSSSAAKFMRGNNKTAYNRLLSGDSNQEARQALKNAVQNPKAVETLLQNGRLNRVLNKFGSKVNRSPEYWLNYFEDNPYLSFRIVPSKKMRDDATLNFVGEREGHGNGGKEDPFNLLTGDEIDNFLTAYNRVSRLNDLKREAMKKFNKSFKSVNNDDNFAPINTPAFNFVSDSGVDAQEDAEFRARFKKMLQTGDKRWMYQDPSRDTVTVWDPETGLFTEEKISDAIKSEKGHKTGYTIDDSYYKRLLNALNSDFSTLQEALDYTSGSPGEGNSFNAMESAIRNNLGNGAVDKAKNLFKDIMSFAGVLSDKDMSKLDGKSILKNVLPFGGALSTTTLRQLQNKFNTLRDKNPGKQLPELLKGGDWLYDTLANGLGYDIDEGLDPRWYKDFVSGQAKINNWRKKREDSIKNMIDSDKLKSWLKYNLDELKKSAGSGDYSRFGKDLDDTDIQVLTGRFNDALMRLYNNDDKEKAVEDMSGYGTTPLPTLAELYSDKYNNLKEEYVNAKDALAKLIEANEGKADTPKIANIREYIDEISSELARMKHEKVPIRELADSDFDGNYAAAEQSYLQSEEEDDLDKWYNTILNKVALTNKMHNLSKEEPDKYASILGILNNIAESYPTSFPGMSDWINTLSDYKDPGKLNDILKSQKASAEMLGLTPEEFSALENNRSAKNSKRQSASLRHRLVGQRKARGSMGSDAYNRADQVADIIQKAENTGNIDKLLDVVGREDSAGLAEAKQEFADSSATLKALLDGIFADTPGDNNGK